VPAAVLSSWRQPTPLAWTEAEERAPDAGGGALFLASRRGARDREQRCAVLAREKSEREEREERGDPDDGERTAIRTNRW